MRTSLPGRLQGSLAAREPRPPPLGPREAGATPGAGAEASAQGRGGAGGTVLRSRASPPRHRICRKGPYLQARRGPRGALGTRRGPATPKGKRCVCVRECARACVRACTRAAERNPERSRAGGKRASRFSRGCTWPRRRTCACRRFRSLPRLSHLAQRVGWTSGAPTPEGRRALGSRCALRAALRGVTTFAGRLRVVSPGVVVVGARG